jgi:hypothetical protein
MFFRALRDEAGRSATQRPPMSIWERNGLRWRDAKWRSANVDRDGVRIRYPGRVPALLHRWPALDRIIMRRHARVFASSMARGFTNAPIAYVFHPMFWPYVEALSSCHVVYHADDRFAAMPGSGPEIMGFERALCERADRVFAITPGVANGPSSMRCGEDRSSYPMEPTRKLRAGSRSPVPALLAEIPRPRIAYAGSLNEKIDFALVNRLASARRGIHWVLIGGVHGAGQMSGETRARLAECRSGRTCTFWASSTYSELPAICAHVDAKRCSIERTAMGGGATSIR